MHKGHAPFLEGFIELGLIAVAGLVALTVLIPALVAVARRSKTLGRITVGIASLWIALFAALYSRFIVPAEAHQQVELERRKAVLAYERQACKTRSEFQVLGKAPVADVIAIDFAQDFDSWFRDFRIQESTLPEYVQLDYSINSKRRPVSARVVIELIEEKVPDLSEGKLYGIRAVIKDPDGKELGRMTDFRVDGRAWCSGIRPFENIEMLTFEVTGRRLGLVP